ncbi:F0F1 ATP synthase subunit epsilon [Rickettsiella endosymbiont of Litargus connexus]|jgi:F-type H+-transporting ATPase subunit epsilon|uniref:F0F1 ATP synthase subunit epsilon n=1 Tax=Rickettsiella endosymbiont of Litargus connexus TaxID=3066237 RepID=UPI00376F3FF7|nr:F0F1 ATP synthase subunit epsilon [Gammaproteobacteria bacterium]MCH9754659.1 F0F1 ATP synthase subunit epsilon [Gammaproteobacteria bacterium]MDD5161392.1 F0F1 ATP synthase subunit epsilon [Candidatus Rickettsiella isopodorum]
MTKTMPIEIVSAEDAIFSGEATHLVAIGLLGELGIYPGHTQLLTALKPGPVRIIKPDGEDEILYISGGILEVQPQLVSILADTAIRAADLDELAALEAKERAERILNDKQADIDYAKATAELAQAVAQLQAISKLKKKPR